MRAQARFRPFDGILWWLIVSIAVGLPAQAQDTHDPKKLVTDAWTALGHFLDDPQQGRFRETLPRAKGILIVPQLVRAGFIVGGAGGRGVLLAREPSGSNWSQPAFVNLSGASLGLQAGADISEVIYLVMTDAGLEALMDSKVKLGGGVGVAGGDTGTGMGGDAGSDLISFGRGKGLYGGVVGKGMALEPDAAAIKAYYGVGASTEDILRKKKVYNRDASKLVSLVAKAARPVAPIKKK